MQKRISVEFVMVMEIPAEPIADSMRRRAMVSWLCVVLLSKLLDVTTEVKYIIYIYIYINKYVTRKRRNYIFPTSLFRESLHSSGV